MVSYRVVKKVILGSIITSAVIVLFTFVSKQTTLSGRTEIINLDDSVFSEYTRGYYFTNYDLTAPKYNPPEHPICVDTLENAESIYKEYIKKYDSIVRERLVYNTKETQKYFEFSDQRSSTQDNSYIQPMRMHRCDYFYPDEYGFYGQEISLDGNISSSKLGTFNKKSYSENDVKDLLTYLWLAYGPGPRNTAKFISGGTKIVLEMEYQEDVMGDWGLPNTFSQVRVSFVFNRADKSIVKNYQTLSSRTY
ncbi:hypothetical protein A3D84_02050 [Candidatus Woesebacteria bacterium RIFCSPHIGHO2_02_FULL_42_20]|uniref:Uncharacterized protein n=1 Tax=Candidatus Woesebacteria bacterium RIFCSPHIGHO2_12_FULL_41_24 TaxID=1802510 RepID=A0A1F8ASW3_9BACT|nr:MAG: hypothetical protein A2W15_04330 [Candidatus Woesebacteria bacterium RBG_16_41_13]OGM30029.1 MAG: hypothetical protein A2873_04885 [Candidatus Woesebacteria bacterium RIFCSPHIGHO2_01_FULL_42_80]OGM35107.1 MAG: hypothetical protein A3D84_02050 [Candidatus Woesebacteria bacterium RIFCSPHIGHO2_02_FULL_42_20]OGM54843.1 MAG: hypothetical protein A3E44_01650 [Candidatus Woesebacteria bacterium RIFCSPHIGHO2_12_FULL_41_24]OGM67459.1 MAG: hypothetical protein A2969_05500 [Candidatus Woesebacteri